MSSRPNSSLSSFSDTALLAEFREKVLSQGRVLYRDLAWRRNFDPYPIWIAEVMLQQTQVSRVEGRWQRWLERWPSIDALASASTNDVLEEWQGLGYNRRALSALACAREISARGGVFPQDTDELVALPGIGPATAAGIRAFAFDLPAVYLETNVRSVFLYELFPDAENVPDSVLVPLIDETCPQDASDPNDDPRTWYYALLDYGAYLKKAGVNPSRRSRTHAKQSRFEGSRRQKRAELVRILLSAGQTSPEGLPVVDVAAALNEVELAAKRPQVADEFVLELLNELAVEGFCSEANGLWHI